MSHSQPKLMTGTPHELGEICGIPPDNVSIQQALDLFYKTGERSVVLVFNNTPGIKTTRTFSIAGLSEDPTKFAEVRQKTLQNKPDDVTDGNYLLASALGELYFILRGKDSKQDFVLDFIFSQSPDASVLVGNCTEFQDSNDISIQWYIFRSGSRVSVQ